MSAEEDEHEFVVVQPDISVVCDDKKLDDNGCKGAPDLIVEVLSPSTWQRDRIEKLNQYQKHGVKEYLLIYPNEKILEQYVLEKNNFYGPPNIYSIEDVFCSHVLPEIEIPLNTLF